MENNNNNNLFTSMFGVESEEQPVPQTPQETKVVQPVIPTTNQMPVVEPVAQVSISTPVEATVIAPPQTPIQAPAVEEIIVLDSHIPAAQPQPVQEEIKQETINSMNIGNNELSLPEQKQDINFSNNDEVPQNYKLIYALMGLAVFIVVVGFPLYNSLTEKLTSSVNDNSNETKELNDSTTTVTEKENDTQDAQKPSTPTIIFDTSLDFDKGYTTTSSELYQTTAYNPKSTEGVIKCESIQNYAFTTHVEKTIIYIYYRDSRAKKTISSSTLQYTNANTYKEGVESFVKFKQQLAGNQNADILLRAVEEQRILQVNLLIDLVYGKALQIDGLNMNYYVAFSYDAPIKDAMNKIINNDLNKGNMVCSTIVTNDVSM